VQRSASSSHAQLDVKASEQTQHLVMLVPYAPAQRLLKVPRTAMQDIAHVAELDTAPGAHGAGRAGAAASAAEQRQRMAAHAKVVTQLSTLSERQGAQACMCSLRGCGRRRARPLRRRDGRG